MYSYEIDELLRNNNYTLENFHYFDTVIREKSPQLQYMLIHNDESKCELKIRAWTNDDYQWDITIINKRGNQV